MRAMLALTATAAAVLALIAAAPAGASSLPHRPPVRRVSLLYAASAAGGTLRSRHGHLELTLTDMDHHVTWFSDRPSRESGALPSRDLAAAWRGFGFDASPPNAALVYTDPATHLERTVILVLRHPRELRGGTAIAFTAVVIDPRRARHGDLADHARSADTHPATTLGNPSLFIDDTTAPVIDGCVLQAYGDCGNANLSGADLSGLDLTGMTFDNTGLSGTSFADTNLSGASFHLIAGSATDFSSANLSDAFVRGADLVSPDFEDANFLDARLVRFLFFEPNLTGAQNLGTVTGCTYEPFAGLAHCGP